MNFYFSKEMYGERASMPGKPRYHDKHGRFYRKIPQRHETLKIHIFTNLKAIALKLWNYFAISEANVIVSSFFGKIKYFKMS